MSAHSTKVFACEFAHHRSRDEIMRAMNKGERISRVVRELEGESADAASSAMVDHPYYRAYFHCWNEQQYYEAHDVLEQVWLNRDSEDDDFFKGLIQAAGAFVHLKKRFEHPTHAKHGRRLPPAVRLFRLAEKNLSKFAPLHHDLDVAVFCKLLRKYADEIVASDYTVNPWSPETAPKLSVGRPHKERRLGQRSNQT
jgi:hypothetical protein